MWPWLMPDIPSEPCCVLLTALYKVLAFKVFWCPNWAVSNPPLHNLVMRKNWGSSCQPSTGRWILRQLVACLLLTLLWARGACYQFGGEPSLWQLALQFILVWWEEKSEPPFREQFNTGAPTLSVIGGICMTALGRNWLIHLGGERAESIMLIYYFLKL